MADEKEPKKKISPKVKKRKKKPPRQRASSESKIVIHPGKEFSFESEDELFKHFKADVDIFEKEFLKLPKADDYSDEEAEKFFHYLDLVLDDPDEIWEDRKTLDSK